MNVELSIVVALVLKILMLLGIGVYTIFAIIIVRQEHLMAHVLEESSEPVLRTLAYMHLVASIGIFLLALVIL